MLARSSFCAANTLPPAYNVISGRLRPGEKGADLTQDTELLGGNTGVQNTDLLTTDLALLWKTEPGGAWVQWEKPQLSARVESCKGPGGEAQG